MPENVKLRCDIYFVWTLHLLLQSLREVVGKSPPPPHPPRFCQFSLRSNTNFHRMFFFFLVHISEHNGNYRIIAFYWYVLCIGKLYCCLGMLMASCFWGVKPILLIILGRKRITLPEPEQLCHHRLTYRYANAM